MKKLALLIFATLILGCDTETSVVEQPPPIIEEPSPVVVSGEHFRLDIDKPRLVAGTVRDGEINVNPEPINAIGLRFDFHEPLKLFKFEILLEGKPLVWIPIGIVDRGHPLHGVIASAIAGNDLQFDTEYLIKIYVQDLACISSRVEIRFRTRPKP